MAAFAQSPGVPVVLQGHGSVPEPDLVAQAEKLRAAGQLLNLEAVKRQFSKSSCRLDLPSAKKRSLSGSEIWSHARDAHLRLGYLYYCPVCKKDHLQLAGGYALTADGAVATCLHSSKQRLEGRLPGGGQRSRRRHAVTDVLACNSATDVCIVRVHSDAPLRRCRSISYHSRRRRLVLQRSGRPAGILQPRHRQPLLTRNGRANAGRKHPLQMNVSSDWGPGSSGAAVVDHFATPSPGPRHQRARLQSSLRSRSGTNRTVVETVIVIHDAICASDVEALIKR